jgi:serine/threonine-protein kinase RsbT
LAQARELRLRIARDPDISTAVLRIGEFADGLGFTVVPRSMIVTAASELATNILKYAGSGELWVRAVERGRSQGLEIVAADRGPGIGDTAQALRDNFSTGGTLGLGLPAVRRLMDEFKLESEVGKGTRVTIRKWR